MGESEIPPFLLTDIHTEDRTKLLNDLQLSVLWLYTNGDKPFDHEAAIRLQSRLRAQYEAKMRERAEKRRKEIEKAEKQSLELHRKIAELVLDVEVFGENVKNATKIGWHEQVRDSITNKTFGSPHTLFESVGGLDFRQNTDARENLDTYLHQLRKCYHDWHYEFSLPREKSTFDEYPKYFTFEVRLKWPIHIGTRKRKRLLKMVS